MKKGYEPFCNFNSIVACSLHNKSTCPGTCNFAKGDEVKAEMPSTKQYSRLEAGVQESKSLSG